MSNLHELSLKTIRLGNKPMAYINPSLKKLTLCEIRETLNYIHIHSIFTLLLFQTLSLPYKHIHYALVPGIYTYFSLMLI